MGDRIEWRQVIARRRVASKGPSVSVLTRLSLKYRILIGLLTAAIAAAGIISTAQLKQELMPSMEIPQGFVTATLDGASPDVMVSEVTEPIENALRAVSEVQSVTSTTSEGLRRSSSRGASTPTSRRLRRIFAQQSSRPRPSARSHRQPSS